MGFDAKKYKNEDFSPRTEAVPVPELAGYFEEGEEKAWTVRSLKGSEIGRVNETGDKYKRLDAMIKAVVDAAGGASKDLIKSFKEQIGMSDGLTEDLARRTELLTIGSVDPTCDTELAGKLREESYPVFRRLTDKIYLLSGQGSQPGKPQGSGETQK